MESKTNSQFWIVSSVQRYYSLQGLKKVLRSAMNIANIYEWIYENDTVLMKNMPFCTSEPHTMILRLLKAYKSLQAMKNE